MYKKLFLLFVTSFAFFMLISHVESLSIDFVSPTPPQDASNSSIIINISTDEPGNHYIFTDWNGSVVGWWMFDYNNGAGIIYDNSSKNNHLSNVSTFDATTDLVQGYWGQGWNATKSVGYLKLTNIPMSTYSISFWIKAEATPETRKYFLSPSTETYPYISHETTGKLMVRYSGGDYIQTSSSIGTSWHHIVIVISTNGQLGTSIWTDGVSGTSASGAPGGPFTFTSSNFKLGSTINAVIDDILIFNRSLTDSEVKSLYNASSNKYSIDFTSVGVAGQRYNYRSYISNLSNSFNSSEIRTFTFQKTIFSIDSPIYAERYFLSPVSLNITTNFDASCKFSFDNGLNNVSMSSANNRNFNYTPSLTSGEYLTKFYCNDSQDNVQASRRFFISDHLTYFVDNSSASCSNAYAKNYATNETTPFCSINSGALSSGVVPGDEIVVLNSSHAYCEGIDVGSTNKNGNSTNPIIIRGESDLQRAYLNGSCASESNGIGITSEDFWIFRYFYIYNFSQDGGNIHASGDNEALNNSFENITFVLNGYDSGGAPGDGMSSHEASLTISRNLNLTNNTKSCATDIANTTTFYYDSYCESPDNWGWYFGAPPGVRQSQYMENTYSYDTPVCLLTGSNFTAIGFTCVHNNYRLSYAAAIVYAKEGIVGDDFIHIANLNISDTKSTADAIKTTDLKLLNITNGYIEGNISLNTNSVAVFTNVTLNGTEEVDATSNLTRKWYYRAFVNYSNGSIAGNVNLTVYNSTNSLVTNLTTNAEGYSQLYEITDYVNNGGTKNYFSNYNISAEIGDYQASHLYNTTSNENNYADVLTLQLVVPASTEDSEPQATIPTGSNGIYSPPFWRNTYKDDSDDLSVLKTITRELKAKERMAIKLANQTHHIGVISIENSSVTVDVSSISQKAVLKPGESAKFDLNNDSFYDLKVTVTQINELTKKAELRIDYLHEEMLSSVSQPQPETTTETEQQTETKEINPKIFFAAAILTLAVIVALVLFARRKKAPRYNHKKFS